MQITAARPRSQVSFGTRPGRIRVHDALRDLALDALGPSGPDGLSAFEWELLSEGLDRALATATDTAVAALDDALRELLSESPRPLVAKVERLRQLTEYGLD